MAEILSPHADPVESSVAQIEAILVRHNQAPSEHGQAAIATSLLAVAEAIKDLAAAVREGNDA